MRVMTLGACLAGIGATATVGYWIHTLDANTRFFTVAGFVSVGVLAGGLALTLVGLLVRERPEGLSQAQRAGDDSTNIQAGRDVQIGGHE